VRTKNITKQTKNEKQKNNTTNQKHTKIPSTFTVKITLICGTPFLAGAMPLIASLIEVSVGLINK
jgi:hypothetical protein